MGVLYQHFPFLNMIFLKRFIFSSQFLWLRHDFQRPVFIVEEIHFQGKRSWNSESSNKILERPIIEMDFQGRILVLVKGCNRCLVALRNTLMNSCHKPTKGFYFYCNVHMHSWGWTLPRSPHPWCISGVHNLLWPLDDIKIRGRCQLHRLSAFDPTQQVPIVI